MLQDEVYLLGCTNSTCFTDWSQHIVVFLVALSARVILHATEALLHLRVCKKTNGTSVGSVYINRVLGSRYHSHTADVKAISRFSTITGNYLRVRLFVSKQITVINVWLVTLVFIGLNVLYNH